jgi:transposase-like protein
MNETDGRGDGGLKKAFEPSARGGGGGVDGGVNALDNGALGEGFGVGRDRVIPDPEVSACAQRRRFPAAYKARIVEEAENGREPGAIGALLRREGLYSSQLSKWREQYRTGALESLRDDKRGRKAMKNPLSDEVERLRKQNARLARRLEQAELIIEIQKKVAAMLGIPLNSVERGEGE